MTFHNKDNVPTESFRRIHDWVDMLPIYGGGKASESRSGSKCSVCNHYPRTKHHLICFRAVCKGIK